MIRATIRLQDCSTNRRRAVIVRGQPAHGSARGLIRTYTVSGPTWTAIRRMLRQLDVIGHTHVRADSVEHWWVAQSTSDAPSLQEIL